VPFGPGGVGDVTIRLAAEPLGQLLGQPVVIENRPGAGGVAAVSAMLNAAADGHTLILVTNGSAIAETQFESLPYDITSDLRPISGLAWFDLVLLTNPAAGLESVADLLTLAGSRASGLRIATINPGSTQHLSAELFKSRAGIAANIITYRTTPDVLAALLRNEIDLVIDAYTPLKGAIDSGQVHVVAVTGEQRNPALTQTPTVMESGIIDFAVTSWNALYAHRDTPDDVVERINQALAELLTAPDLQQRFSNLGAEARHTSPAEIQERLLDDIVKWRAVMIAAGLANN
jgi:tripartite-type tricarboxylate transporter receptor subunit TctC